MKADGLSLLRGPPRTHGSRVYSKEWCDWDFKDGDDPKQPVKCYCVLWCVDEATKKGGVCIDETKYECKSRKYREKNPDVSSIKESKTPDENASIKYGNGFALIIASFFAYLFFH
uniref:Uncharacterized protein n=1 Tax=Panagrolaimus davidi TaxID=227884 RepID=A0A914QPJ7_9BILA